MCMLDDGPLAEAGTKLLACEDRVMHLTVEIGRLQALVLSLQRDEPTRGGRDRIIGGGVGVRVKTATKGPSGMAATLIGREGLDDAHRRRQEVAGGEVVAVEPSEARCTIAEEERLVAFGMQTSRLDERQTVVDLMGRGVDKQPLRSAVGLLSTGGAYSINAECTWLIAPPNASNVTLEFYSFATEENYDYVEVYDGPDSSGTMLKSLSGMELPSPITSTSGSMFVRLTSDSVATRKGFTATYRADNAPPGAVAVEEPSSNVCLPTDAKVYVSSACRSCIMATIAGLCGEGCVQEQLHLVAAPGVGMPSPSPCLPALRTRLATEQTGRLQIAVARGEPFGLTCGSASDLYIASRATRPEPIHYIGLDTGYRLASCGPKEHAHLWVITRSTDRAEWEACRGELWINMRTGEARSELTSRGGVEANVPMLMHSSLGECSAALDTAVPVTSDGNLFFGIDTPAATVACWLQRFFGPQAATIGVAAAPSVVEMAVGLDLLRPLSDLVVGAGQRVTLLGHGAELQLGDRQVRVMRGGELTLDSLVVAGSTGSSALVVEGKLVLRNTTVRNCSARMNVVGNEGLASRGGGAYVTSGGTMEVLDSRMAGNVAREGMCCSEGGAIYATNGSSVTVVGSELVENKAQDGGDRSSGGAIDAFGGSALLVVGSTLRGNIVERGGSQCYGGAVHLAQECTGEVTTSALHDNVASTSRDAVWGGAIMVEKSSMLKLGGSRLERNVAESGRRCYGGAMAVFDGSSAAVAETVIAENSARDASEYAMGGGAFVRSSSTIDVTSSSLRNNSATRSGQGSYGGALCLYHDSTGDIRSTELLGNSASDGILTSQGGAIYLDGNASVRLVNATVDGNAAERSNITEGGAIFVEGGSSLTALDSRLVNNAALDGTRFSRGGAISTAVLAMVRLERTPLLDNRASSEHPGASTFGGALYAAAAPSTIDIAGGEMLRNGATSNGGSAAGGGLHVGQQVSVRMSATEVSENRAEGGTAEGGAIWFAGETLDLTEVLLTRNVASANGAGGRAVGGALFLAGVSAQLLDCRVFDNRAHISSPAVRASGGAVHADVGAKLRMLRCVLRHNAAGGAGYYYDVPSLVRERDSSAIHMYSQGFVTLDDCDITDDLGPAVLDKPADSAWFWIVVDGGTFELRSSRFSTSAAYFFDPCDSQDNGGCDPEEEPIGSLCPVGSDYVDCGTEPPLEAGPFGRLINVRVRQAQLLVRGCTTTNLTVHATALDVPIGIVNSTFEPALNASLLPTVQPSPKCGTRVAGPDTLCDPRAACWARSSGGVECACTGKGLHDRPGTYPDGGACVQDTSVAMLIQTRHIIILVYKPGNHTETVHVVVRAEGEQPFAAPYNMSMARVSSREQVVGTSAWSRVDEQRLSLDGHHALWVMPPSSDSRFDLDLKRQLFSATKEYMLQLRLDCGGQQPCIADGDKVTTVINIGDASSPSRQRAAVSITTEVAALVSCRRTVVWLDGSAESVPSSSVIVVRLRAIDVDDMPIEQTRAEVEFHFGNATVPVNWNRGSNEYVASVPPELTRQAGEYELVVTAMHGWDEGANQRARCVLLRRRIHVDEGFNSSLVLGISLCCCVVLVVGLVIWVRRRSDQLRHILTMVLTEVGKLIISICFELGDLATDVLTTCRVVFEEGFVEVQGYRVAYAVFGCLAVTSSLVSIVYRIRHAQHVRTQIRNVASSVALGEDDVKGSLLSKLRWEQSKVSRDLRAKAVTLLGLVLEDVPMVTLSCLLVLREGNTDRMVVVSLLISVLMLGHKVGTVNGIVNSVNRRKEIDEVLGQLEGSQSQSELPPGLVKHARRLTLRDRDDDLVQVQPAPKKSIAPGASPTEARTLAVVP